MIISGALIVSGTLFIVGSYLSQRKKDVDNMLGWAMACWILAILAWVADLAL